LLTGQLQASTLLERNSYTAVTDADPETPGGSIAGVNSTTTAAAAQRLQATFLSEVILHNSKLTIDPALLEEIDQVIYLF
jgi:AICAR transformylase/IMP cyclohydrolase PurH